MVSDCQPRELEDEPLPLSPDHELGLGLERIAAVLEQYRDAQMDEDRQAEIRDAFEKIS